MTDRERIDEILRSCCRDFVTNRVLLEVLEERRRQFSKWGQQDWPDGTGDEFRSRAVRAKDQCDDAHWYKTLTFQHILSEEVYEALAESDEARLRAELVQVAAVAVQWVEAIDRRKGGKP